MEFNKVRSLVAAKPAASFRSMVWERPLKARAAFKGHTITKRTSGSGLRFGVTYDAMQAVQKKREDGSLPAENQGLKGRVWLVPNLFMETSKGNKLLRVSMAQSTRMTTEYFINGRPATLSEVEPMVIASEIKGRHEGLDVFDVNTESIISIN